MDVEQYESALKLLTDIGVSEEDAERVLELSALQGGIDIAQGEAGYWDPQSVRWPRGRWTGRTYTKAHPLEHVAAGVEKIRAGIERDKAVRRQEQLLNEIVGARKTALEMLLKQQSGETGQQNPGTTGRATQGARSYPLGARPGNRTSGWVPVP